MSHCRPTHSQDPSSSVNRRARHIKDLERELRRTKDQFAALRLSYANQLCVITEIHRIITLSQSQPPAFETIRNLIVKNIDEIRPEPDPYRPLHAAPTNHVTSPPASTDSPLSTQCSFDNFTSSEDDSGHSSKITGKRTKHSALHNNSIVSEKDAQHPEQESHTPIEEDEDSADETWHEFSLEEELEGIADAPVQERAAMRAALKEKKDARKKMMQDSAEEKRRIAEREGLRMKRVIPRSQVRPMPAGGAFEPEKPLSDIDAIARETSEDDHDDDGESKVKQLNSCHPFPNNIPEIGSSPGIISISESSPRNAERFGIVFDPLCLDSAMTLMLSGARNSADTRRSVLIQNIPGDFTIHKLLAYVCGGTIVTARLVPYALNIGPGQVALVTFKTAREASTCYRITGRMFANYERRGNATPQPMVNLRVSLLQTPTYPTREAIPFQGSELSKLSDTSRCIVIDGFPKQHVNVLCSELSLDVHRLPNMVHTLEEMWFEGDTLHINFTSIQDAVKAYHIINLFHYGKFNKRTRFGTDPCSRGVALADFTADQGSMKLASDGYMGLKSLLETVGLAAYSRSHATGLGGNVKEINATASAHSSNHRTVEVGRTHGKAKVEGEDILIDISSVDDKEGDATSVQMTSATSSTTPFTTPWTDDHMKGLDML